MGVWIETYANLNKVNHKPSHTLRGCVDWNLSAVSITISHTRSHPSWVCGLKQLWFSNTAAEAAVTPFVGVWIETYCPIGTRYKILSHPSWVCGLKLFHRTQNAWYHSHTLRGCVDWNFIAAIITILSFVTPFVGVWIETSESSFFNSDLASHPSWVCGLKLSRFYQALDDLMSHPSWVCGLKLKVFRKATILWSHTLRGCVDWNFCTTLENLQKRSHTLRGCVDWNIKETVTKSTVKSHTLRGCVDWNLSKSSINEDKAESHPSWVCGLKLKISSKLWRLVESHPSWVCGLKLQAQDDCLNYYVSHPSWVCGLKPLMLQMMLVVGRSHPSWVCGLKHMIAQE